MIKLSTQIRIYQRLARCKEVLEDVEEFLRKYVAAGQLAGNGAVVQALPPPFQVQSSVKDLLVEIRSSNPEEAQDLTAMKLYNIAKMVVIWGRSSGRTLTSMETRMVKDATELITEIDNCDPVEEV